jgi:hypothetical protein
LKSLYLRIWLTVVAALALFALVSGWLWQRHLDQERARFEAAASERLAAWAELVQRSHCRRPMHRLAEQAEALRRVVLAAARCRWRWTTARPAHRRIAERSCAASRAGAWPRLAVRLDDGRTLWMARTRMAAPRCRPVTRSWPPASVDGEIADLAAAPMAGCNPAPPRHALPGPSAARAAGPPRPRPALGERSPDGAAG